ncbi:MAG: hypothetical protein J2P25_15795 [Nocardiopsaceae bacterium]|nr:hypothetical protein [Nocardiopsaceae bacterium]
MIAAIVDDGAPPVSGFVESAFSPLAYQAVSQCLTGLQCPTGQPSPTGRPADGARTALVLASTMGDADTLDLGSRRLVAGQVNNPLLFMQSTANAILGRICLDFAITGPTLAISVLGDLAGELLATAELLRADEDPDRIVLVGVELAGSERAAAAHRELGTCPPAASAAVAIALDRGEEIPPVPPAGPATYGSLRGLAEVAARIRGATP